MVAVGNYTVPQKTPPIISESMHCRIFIIFGINIRPTEKVCNQKMLYFPSHLIKAPLSDFHTLGLHLKMSGLFLDTV